jgi:predicted transcriptional regulator
MLDGEESKEDLRNLLGYMGIEILFAIDKGAKNFETIKLFSGLPISCVKGRIPVLLELNLIKIVKKEYFLTEKGNDLKNQLELNSY